MSVRSAQFLLAAVISARATSFVFSKLLLQNLGPFSLLALRFCIALVLLSVIFFKRLRALSRHDFICGIIMGFLLFGVMSCDHLALTYANTSTVSFLESCAIVFVPVGEAILTKKFPAHKCLFSALLAIFGIGLLSFNGTGFSFGHGEIIALTAAVFYSIVMIYTQRVTNSGDSLAMGIVQVGTVGILGLITAFMREQPALPTTLPEWAYLGALVIVCTGFGFTLQPVAQRPLTPSQSSIMIALNPLISTILGILVMREHIAPQGFLGLACILSGIAISAIKIPAIKWPNIQWHNLQASQKISKASAE